MRQIFSPAVPTAHVWVAKGLTAYAEIVLTAQGHIIFFFHLLSLLRNSRNETVPITGFFYGPKIGILPVSAR